MSEQLSREEQLKRKRAYWKRQIEVWQGSGMSQSDFCRKHNLKPYLFTYWKKRFVQSKTGTTFVPVKLQSSGTGFKLRLIRPDSLRIIVGTDIQIEVNQNFDPRFLRAVIDAVRSPS